MFVLATWFLPLALSILWPQLLTWNLHNTWQFCSDSWDCFSSEFFLVLSGTFLYCFDKQEFPKLLAFYLPQFFLSLLLQFSNKFCTRVFCRMSIFLLFCLFTLFCLFATRVFVWLSHNFKQHMANKFLSKFKHFTRQLAICCLKFAP